MIDVMHFQRAKRKFLWAGLSLVFILVVGTIGYWLIGERKFSMFNCLYITIIATTSLGYHEIGEIAGEPTGRMFTLLMHLSGLGFVTYILSNLTAYLVEGEFNEVIRRKKMERMIKKFKNHYIVCGVDAVGSYVVSELCETKRPYVIIDIDRKKIEKILETFPDQAFIEGDATYSDTLLKAGVDKAEGLFAVTGDDNHNLVISLTAKQLSSNIRVVARCQDLKNMEKMKKAGADAIVSPTFIGGLRMASEMIRPTVVSFLDVMLRDKEKNLRIEEVSTPDSFSGKTISTLNLKEYPHTLLLCIKTRDEWIYNPSADYILKSRDTLIFMTNPEERYELEKIFQ